MEPANFPQSNMVFTAPRGHEQDVLSIPGARITVDAGPMEGLKADVVAWKPNDKEKEAIAAGAPIFVTFVGGIVVHGLSTEFPFTLVEIHPKG